MSALCLKGSGLLPRSRLRAARKEAASGLLWLSIGREYADGEREAAQLYQRGNSKLYFLPDIV